MKNREGRDWNAVDTDEKLHKAFLFLSGGSVLVPYRFVTHTDYRHVKLEPTFG